MKKITKEEAIDLLKHGIFPKCKVSREVFKSVKSEQELENFLNLSSFQKCQFYGYSKKEIEDFTIPSNSLPISVNEATDMLASAETIYARKIGEGEQIFSDLESFVTFLKQCELVGDSFLLYWHE